MSPVQRIIGMAVVCIVLRLQTKAILSFPVTGEVIPMIAVVFIIVHSRGLRYRRP